jgi:hypothetical protein
MWNLDFKKSHERRSRRKTIWEEGDWEEGTRKGIHG